MFINQILAKLKTSVYSKSETETLLNSKGFITSEIDSMGEGWVRFKCGLQICWGWKFATSTTDLEISFPKAFIRDAWHQLSVSVSGQSDTIYPLGWNEVTAQIANTNMGAITYTAVGWWK